MAVSASLRPHIRQFLRELEQADQERVKVANTAVRVELYRLGAVLRKDVHSGKYTEPELSVVAWWSKRHARTYKKEPLSRLGGFVGYQVKLGRDGGEAEVGFVHPTRMTGRWRRIIMKQQEGFETTPSEALRSFWRRRGGELAKGRNQAAAMDARYFFLRKTTRTTRTPGRDIVEPFWGDHKAEAWRNIRSNFIRKMAGERI